MRRLSVIIFASVLGTQALACTADLGSCDVDPTVDCFKGKGGASSGTAAGGAAGAGAISSGTSGAAGTGTTTACDCMADPSSCGKCDGAACDTGQECKSGFCADMVCCDAAC